MAATVPVIMMAGAWSAAVAQTSSGSDTVAAGREVSVPDVPSSDSSVPLVTTAPITTPALPPAAAPLAPASTITTSDVPVAALAAYQRASSVLAASDAACRLPWNLVAAIGKVESNHGRFGGNVVGDDGVSRPGVRGIALDGANDTARILDSDAGSLDGDAVYDRAVGPMQFIPSTWSAVAVDGNGDGVKNPQDVNDAAVSAGVYLCSGGADLSTPEGARSAVLRYNQSSQYADLVLSISGRYAAGDFTQAPDNLAVPVDTTLGLPAPTEVATPGKGRTEVAAATLRPRGGATITPKAPLTVTPAPAPTTPAVPPTDVTPPAGGGDSDESTTPPSEPTNPPATSTPDPEPSESTPSPEPSDDATTEPSPSPEPSEDATAEPEAEETTEPEPSPEPEPSTPSDECASGTTRVTSSNAAGGAESGSCAPPCPDGTEPGASASSPCAVTGRD